MAPRVLPVCSVQVAVPTSSRLEGQLGAKWAVGRDKKTLLLTFPLPSGGFLFQAGRFSSCFYQGSQRENLRDLFYSPIASAWIGGGTLRGRCVFGRATSLAILVAARPLPDPGLPQDQPQRLGRQPGPPFPAW